MTLKYVEKLRRIVGEDNVLDDMYGLIPYREAGMIGFSDVDAVTGKPLDETDLPMAVVRPKNAEEISEVLKLANKSDLKIRIRGAGTTHVQAMAHKNEIVLDMKRLHWINLHEEDQTVEVGPAVRPIELIETLEKHGYKWATFPGGYRVASFGGNIAINTSGHGVDPYTGKPGDHVLGLEVVLPTGEIIETGSRGFRRPAGPDLTRIFIGSEGHLGVITNIRLKLTPKGSETQRAVVIWENIYDGAKGVQRMFRDKAPFPIWLELMDEKYTKLGFKHIEKEDPEGANIQVVTDGYMPGEADWKMEKILEAFKKENPKAIQIYSEGEEWKKMIRMREAPMKIVNQPYVSPVIDPPLSKLLDVLKEVYKLPGRMKSIDPSKLDLFVFGHFGGITIHNMAFMPWDLDPKTRWRVNKEYRLRSYQISLKYDSTWGEQGIFPEHAKLWIGTYGQKSFELLKVLKAAFDPNNTVNPTNLIWEDPPPPLE